jgi:RNA polymerase sigma-70 factor (ECF subfamily)
MDGSPQDVAGGSLVAAAQGGDEAAFEALVGPHRRELHAHCYRMLGSVHDADDVLQEVLLRAWRGLGGFQGRSSVRAWLYRIATNACLNAIESRSRRFLPADVGPAAADAPVTEAIWIEPYPGTSAHAVDEGGPVARYEQRESLELAFVAALQYLPAKQRAALILRDVLGFSARDAAEVLETTTAAVNSALQCARVNAQTRIPERSQHATLRALDDDQLRQVVGQYVRALEDADLDAMVALLSEDATWSMPPSPDWYQGHEAIGAFLLAGPFTTRWRHIPTQASGQPAVGCYAWDDAAGCYLSHVLDVLTFDGQQITAVTAFIDARLFRRFGLPAQLPA